ncbi:MAG TPA: hypothetical protein VFV47_00305 [Hyphomicrobiaceae bacterium]|nr:hypothetical protein [Hyphomicrobiaceae bacterium]
MGPDHANKGKGGTGAEKDRKERLAAQLRENLKRRKARERAIEARQPDPSEDTTTGPGAKSGPDADPGDRS